MDSIKGNLLLALKELKLRVKVQAGFDELVGICHNATKLCDYSGSGHGLKIYTIISDYSENWVGYSGVKGFPVPYSTLTPMDAYNTIENVWIGEYGNNRMKLLDYLIECLEKEMNK